MSLRAELEAAQRNVAVVESTDESYTDAIKVLARYFLEALDQKPPDWYPRTDSSNDLGDVLYADVRDRLPQELRRELSGGQVSMAAHVAYRAWKGD